MNDLLLVKRIICFVAISFAMNAHASQDILLQREEEAANRNLQVVKSKKISPYAGINREQALALEAQVFADYVLSTLLRLNS